jgi:hypothetical protein
MRHILYVTPGLLCCLAVVSAAPPEIPKKVRPTALEVNTKDDEDEPHVLGNQLFYCSNTSGKVSILQSTRQSPLDRWGKGKPVDGVGTEVEDRGAFLVSQRDGFQYLFFATLRDKDTKNFDIYVAQRTDLKSAFSATAPVNAVDTEADEQHPWLTPDGKQMYFSRKVGQHWRVFVASRPTGLGPQFTGEPAEIKELPDDFHHATVSSDGRTMYLQGPVGGGRWGLFRSTKAGGKWGQPEALSMLNDPDGPGGDRSPGLSRDPASGTLYFASDRPGGKGGLDLYSVFVSALRK